MTVDEVLDMLDQFRLTGQIDYDAYSALHDAVSEICVEFKTSQLFHEIEWVKLERGFNGTNYPPEDETVLLRFPHNIAAGFYEGTRHANFGVWSGDSFYTEIGDDEEQPTHYAKLPDSVKGR